MKYLLLTLLSFFVLGLNGQKDSISANNNVIHVLHSYYKKEMTDKLSFNSIVKDSVSLYNIKGTIRFDNDGNTIQKTTRKKKIREKKIAKILEKLKKQGYMPAFEDHPMVLYIQIQAKDNKNILQKGKIISQKIDDKLMRNSLGETYGLNQGENVVNVEFSTKDINKALDFVFEALQSEDILQNSIIGYRLYFEKDDYNYEIIYPLGYSGIFYPY